jgi:alkanesulfonate monooxygenase SsuD/methylene tetrahydromethanopterin reductase-like flavin-dependent oxidoreductase (luciferase family)
LSHIAARTTTFRLGTAVIVLPWRNPILLAEEVATLDVLSHGRIDLGIGKGYRVNEFRGMGIPFDEASERYAEDVEILQKAWANETRWDFEGRFWRFHDVVVEPRPVQQPFPLWVGASSPASITTAAEQGFNLLLDMAGSFELTGERVARYRDALTTAGHTWDPTRVALTRALFITTKKDEAWERSIESLRGFGERLRALAFDPDDPRLARPEELPTGDLFYSDFRLATEQSAIMGTPDECIETLKLLERCGVEHVLMTAGRGIEALRLFHKEVMPEFAAGSTAAGAVDSAPGVANA